MRRLFELFSDILTSSNLTISSYYETAKINNLCGVVEKFLFLYFQTYGKCKY